MKMTFDNGADKKSARAHLQSRSAFFKRCMKADDLENISDGSETQSFYEYGLSVDYVAPGTWDDQTEGYLRYQLSWGGPSEEVRFYYSPGAKQPYRIEFVFLEWFKGIGYDVTGEEWAKWLANWFYDCGTVEAEINRAMEEA